MRYLFGLTCVLALGVVLLVGCTDDGGTGGSGGSAGDGGAGGSMGDVFPCTEQGIRDAIAEGGGPHTFDCEGAQTVVTQAEIEIDNSVILDGEGNLIVDGDGDHRVLSVPEGVTAELHGFTVQHGAGIAEDGGGVANEGVLTIRDCLISGNMAERFDQVPAGGSGAGIYNGGEMAIFDTIVSRNHSSLDFDGGAGIHNTGEMSIAASIVSDNYADHGRGGGVSNTASGTLRLMSSTVSDNNAGFDGDGTAGGGIYNAGEMTMLNSTVSRNSVECLGACNGGGIGNVGKMRILNSTLSGNSADFAGDAIGTESNRHAPDVPYLEMANTLIDGDCHEFLRDALDPKAMWVSNGYNIESPGNSCGFDQLTDQVDIPDPMLEPLQDNGGPTETHALLSGSPAIDQIPETECLDADGKPLMTDQRGKPRPAGAEPKCDVGAFEVQP